MNVSLRGKDFCLCVCCYLTQLSYPGDGSLASVLSVHSVLLEKQEDLVVFGVVALWDQVHADEPGVWRRKKHKHTLFLSRLSCTDKLTIYCIMYFTIRPLPSMANPLAPILHLWNQSPVIFSSHGSVITAIHFTPCCHSIWLYPKWVLQVQIPHNPCLWTTSSQNTHGSDCPG